MTRTTEIPRLLLHAIDATDLEGFAPEIPNCSAFVVMAYLSQQQGWKAVETATQLAQARTAARHALRLGALRVRIFHVHSL